ncbi:PREDICTED: uncharacterized protein LOC106805535 [Priapulus caudatus]|uniref:Uncharacterized protein LOC106805535 n=1 Tax=Priapulus caudatus TaxID=37621 RepID=A0ABM1DRT3_PRICU|nr:PREDICTED: uncharacterized protein LOC106805535 [Priapulus caudatus]
MPSPHFNHYSWSFAFAVTGTMAEFAAALFFGTLAMRNNREHNMRSERMQRPPNGVHQAPPARGQYPTKQPQLQPQPTRTQPPGPGYPHTITKSASKEDTV